MLLSNLYTTKKQYSEAGLLKNKAKSRKMMKTPGCTLIEIGEKQHLFVADILHVLV